MGDINPMDLLYPNPLTKAFIKQMDAEGRLTKELARACGKLSGEMLFFGKTDEEVLAAMKDIFST